MDESTVAVVVGDRRLPPEFWAHVAAGPECWAWTGQMRPDGYAGFRREWAHRFVYRTIVGSLPPEGWIVGHRCHDEAFARGECPGGECAHRACVNPAHLVALPFRDNLLRGKPSPVDRPSGRGHRRANGEGTIFPYRDRWRGAVTWTDADGIRHKRVFTSKVKDEVRREVARLRAGLDQGIAPPSKTTVADFLTTWLEASHQRIRPSTWRGYESCVRVYLVPAFGAVELGKLTPSDVEKMTAGLIADGRAPRTAALARTVLRLALGDAVRDQLVVRNVGALARPPYVPTRTLEVGRDYLDASQLRRLVTAAKVHPMGPLVTIAATTGLRLGEILGLEWHDVDDVAETLSVRRSLARTRDGWALSEPKTRRSRRTIDLPAAAIVALDRQRELQDIARGVMGTAWQDTDGLVFTDPVGRPLKGAFVNHRFHDILDAAGLPSIPLHGLRHSAATAMLAAGVALKVVSDQLGHSTIAITADRYAGTTPAMRRSAADAMDKALGS